MNFFVQCLCVFGTSVVLIRGYYLIGRWRSLGRIAFKTSIKPLASAPRPTDILGEIVVQQMLMRPELASRQKVKDSDYYLYQTEYIEVWRDKEHDIEVVRNVLRMTASVDFKFLKYKGEKLELSPEIRDKLNRTLTECLLANERNAKIKSAYDSDLKALTAIEEILK